MLVRGEGILVVPGVDLFNHHPRLRGARCIYAEDGCVVVRAAESYEAGDECFISYGDESNSSRREHARCRSTCLARRDLLRNPFRAICPPSLGRETHGKGWRSFVSQDPCRKV